MISCRGNRGEVGGGGCSRRIGKAYQMNRPIVLYDKQIHCISVPSVWVSNPHCIGILDIYIRQIEPHAVRRRDFSRYPELGHISSSFFFNPPPRLYRARRSNHGFLALKSNNTTHTEKISVKSAHTQPTTGHRKEGEGEETTNRCYNAHNSPSPPPPLPTPTAHPPTSYYKNAPTSPQTPTPHPPSPQPPYSPSPSP